MPALTPPRDLVKLWWRVAPSSSCNVHKNTSLVVAGAATNNNHTMHWLGWIGVAPMPHHVHVQNIIKKEMLRFLELQKYKRRSKRNERAIRQAIARYSGASL
jgi:hypothetical protein